MSIDKKNYTNFSLHKSNNKKINKTFLEIDCMFNIFLSKFESLSIYFFSISKCLILYTQTVCRFIKNRLPLPEKKLYGAQLAMKFVMILMIR